MSEPAMKNDCRPMHGTVDADLWDAKQHRARLAARVMNYEGAKAKFVEWAKKNAYDESDRDLWDAFFGGVVAAELYGVPETAGGGMSDFQHALIADLRECAASPGTKPQNYLGDMCSRAADALGGPTLEDAYAEGRADEREEWAPVLAALQTITAMCEAAGDFSNGVTDPTGTIDEGAIRASEVIREARAAIAKATETVSA
jgi:hypothetical protein